MNHKIFLGANVRELFVMLTTKKVIFVIDMQKFITSNIRHLQIKKIITLLFSLLFFPPRIYSADKIKLISAQQNDSIK